MRPTFARTTLATVFATTTLVAAGCRSKAPEAVAATKAVPEVAALGGIVGQALIIAPVQMARVAPDLAWTSVPAATALAQRLDSAIAETLKMRVRNAQWVYFDGLAKSFANNSQYATDPHLLAINPLRSPRLKIDERLPEPIASQLRTMIAFHDARLVLLPVDLHFDRTPEGMGRAVLRLVLVDPRSSVVRWIGEVSGADSPVFSSAYSALIADRLADLFVEK